MKRLICFLLLALSLSAPYPCAAKSAGIMMVPTRVVLDTRDRYSTIMIKNPGDATGNFSVELVDMKMLESGVVVPLDAGETPAYSAIPFLHISPRSMTLRPGETQTVRMMLRKPEGLPAGEYRAHVKVRLVDDNNAEEATGMAGNTAAITVKANLVIVAPVIVRNGETNLSMRIEEPRLTWGQKGTAAVELYLAREGNRSSMGDIIVIHHAPDGASQVLKVFHGVSVYRPTRRRFLSVPLDEIAKGVDLRHGRLAIAYLAEQKEGGKPLAEADLDLR